MCSMKNTANMQKTNAKPFASIRSKTCFLFLCL